MKPCQVKAIFNQAGEPRPSEILWDETVYLIQDIGRRWSTEGGQHFLVRIGDGRVLELVYNGAAWQGQVVSQPPSAI